jgi:GTP cyclohydrolase I
MSAGDPAGGEEVAGTGASLARLPAAAGHYDADRVQAAVHELLAAIGEDPNRAGLVATPARVARGYAELFGGLQVDPDSVLDAFFSETYDEVVLVRDIPLYSMCEHHLLPWTGRAHVGYLPNTQGRITGLSKLARLVDVLARRPQLQERLTTQVADVLDRVLRPRGVMVVVEAEHLCMTMRGVRQPGTTTVTSQLRGAFRDSPATRAEAMSLLRPTGQR